ncbi:MAG: hypothetical protein ACE5GS_08580 [Kiloniellaceae bacterium]
MARVNDRQAVDGQEQPAPDAAAPGAGLLAEGPDVLFVDFEHLAPAETGDSVVLTLGDLLPDAAGEVVLFAGGDVPVNLVTAESLAEAGIAAEHVTASGLEVTGLHFYSFESGITVYSPTDLLIVNDPNAA